MADIQSATAAIRRRKKKKIEEETTGQKYNVRIYYTQGGHNNAFCWKQPIYGTGLHAARWMFVGLSERQKMPLIRVPAAAETATQDRSA